MLSRRRLITNAGLAGGAALGLSSVGKLDAAIGKPMLPFTGERFGGFVLLPPGALTPQDVVPVKRQPPRMCFVGTEEEDVPLKVERSMSEPAYSPDELALRAGFPAYDPHLEPAGGNVTLYPDGEVFLAVMSFNSADAQTGEISANVYIMARPDFQKPLPLWESYPAEPDRPGISLQKASFLPSPGIMVRTTTGFAFQWIANDVHYVMSVDNNCTPREARSLVESMTLVRPGR